MTDTELVVLQIAWEITPVVLISGAWWRWRKAQRPRDRPFLIGASLASVSCLEMLFFGIAPVGERRFGQLLVYAVGYGALAAVLCTVAALLMLPFASLKAKWLAFASSLMILVFVAFFLFSLAA